MTKREYMAQKESEGWSVWTVGLSGSRQDYCGWYRTKRGALRAIESMHAFDASAYVYEMRP